MTKTALFYKTCSAIVIVLLLLISTNHTFSQTIPGTGTSSSICGNCNPTNWDDADPLVDGTPDISNRNQAGANFGTGGNAGYNATWVNAPLPLPPTGDVRWITLRDVGSSGSSSEENVTTTMTDLVVGKLYKLVINSMTVISNEDGGDANDQFYAGTYIEDFDIQIGNAPRRTISSVTQDVWGKNTIIFIASATSETFTIFPGADSGFADTLATLNLVETVHISVDGVSALELLDTDGDGIDDADDIDDDNDGILDITESGGNQPNGDEDGDGIPNYLDDFDDDTDNVIGDGSMTDYGGFPDVYDFDRDGIPNHLDLDADNDGILDNREAQDALGYTAPSGSVGANGLYDIYENNDTQAATSNLNLNDTDTTGNPDYLDIDSDDDGIPDNVEAQSTTGYIAPTGNIGENGVDSVYESNDSFSPLSLTPVNTDKVDLQDYRDLNSDNDNFLDIEENGDTDDVLSGTDTDGDGLDDNFDSDNVNYDVNDNINNPSIDLPNADSGIDNQVDFRDAVTGLDTDGDGIPDNVDIDDDNDGILDTVECPNLGPISAGNASGVADSNSVSNPGRAINGTATSRSGLNAVSDFLIIDLGYLIPAGTDIFIEARVSNNLHQMGVEESIDGVTYLTEQNYTFAAIAGSNTVQTYTLTNTARFIRITVSVDAGSGALQVGSVGYEAFTLTACRDTDSDGIPDALDIDADNDGIIDNIEAQTTAGYVARSGTVGANGLYDIYEDTPDDGISILPITNTDTDSLPDYLDLDADDDGIPDNVEAQTTLGYAAPNGNVGSNGLDSAYDFIDTFASLGISPYNHDGDASPDFRDTDADNDGTNDIAENNSPNNITIDSDLNNNGLDDNFDAVGNLPYDVNDIIDNPSVNMADADADINSGGDADYRDIFDGIDTDKDGIANADDLDDDGDGIPDSVECFSVAYAAANASAVASSNSVTNPNNAIGDNNAYANLNNSSTDFLIINLGKDVVAGTIIEIRSRVGNLGNEMTVSSSIGSSGFANPTTYTYTSGVNIEEVKNYTLTIDARYIRIVISTRVTSNLGIDNVSYQAYTAPCEGDTDGDGINDSLDLDSDNDGILDNIEAMSDANYVAPTNNDEDLDGLDDAYDADCTGANCAGVTGFPISAPQNSDADTRPDYLDIDADNDGIPDNIEAQGTSGYVLPTGIFGSNGIDSAYENNDTYNAVGLTPVNSDNLDLPDYRDLNSDNDTLNDIEENGMANVITTPSDTDNDGLDDIFEGVDNNDGYDVNDEIENPETDLPDEDGDAGAAGDVDYRDGTNIPDTDGDNIINSIDLDDDNDGIPDINESDGNDPDGDEDNDGILNYQDNSDDGDGGPGGTTVYTDTNMDGIPDVYDFDSDGVPNHLDIDADNDGIPDNVEAQTTATYRGLANEDSDNDGIDDAYDTDCALVGDCDGIIGVDLSSPNNHDGIDNPDYLDLDSDNDLTPDIEENGDADNVASGTDSDGDGLDDNFEGSNATAGEAWDPNDEINDPTDDLPDTDGDSGSGGDMDYRDDTDDSVPVATGTTLWLRADKNVTGGATVTSWIDQTAALDFTSANAGTSPDATVNSLNFNPVVTFTPANEDVLTLSSLNLNPRSMYIVYNDIATASSTTPFTNDDTDDGNGIGFGHTDDTQIYNNPGTPADVRNGTEYNNGLAIDFTTLARPDAFQLHSRIFAGNLSDANHTYYVGKDRTNAGTGINGSIAEIMLFDAAHANDRRQQIESYLALKYGFTLSDALNPGSTVTEGDYVSQDLTLIWDHTANSTYHNDVAGIGRDDAMAFQQRQSKSVNSDAIITIGLKTIAADNLSNPNNISANKSFLIWGNNGSDTNNTSTATLICAPEIKLDRVWKIVETGTIGTARVAVTKSVIDTQLSTPSTIKVMKIADDAAFTTNVKHIPLKATDVVTIDGVDHYFVDYNFTGAKFFTYAEINGIFWNGNAGEWTGGTGATDGPSTNVNDLDKILVVDAETSLANAFLNENANVECVWVKKNSKLVVASNLFLEFDEELVLDGQIRLIDDAQLVQTHLGFSNVTGTGKLFRDQKATVSNVYRYHYWSSPVVATNGNTTFTVADVMKDGTTKTSANSTQKNINFITYNGDPNTYNGATTDPITIANYWIYSFFNGVTSADYVQQLHTGNINIGEGYIMKSTGRSPQNFTFIGSPNDGTIMKTVDPGTASLVGNPYPSALNATTFLNANNDALDATLYFWQHTGEVSNSTVIEGHTKAGYFGGYSQRNLAMGVAANQPSDNTAGLGDATYKVPTEFIPVGMGFFVSAPADKGGDFLFENAQRVSSTAGVFFKSSKKSKSPESIPTLKLGLNYINEASVELHRQIGISFIENNTFEFESGYDSEIFDIGATDLYWKFPKIDSKLVIAGVGKIENGMQIPVSLAVDSENPIQFMIDERVAIDSGIAIFLVDLVTGQIHNLIEPKELSLAKGTYEDRFILVFDASVLAVENMLFSKNISVFMNNIQNEIIVNNTSSAAVKKVEMYTLLGQKVQSWKPEENQQKNRFKVHQTATGVYIIKVQTAKGSFSKKVFKE
ncbi:T9SS type A sorting domain-containing protein [uncultured Polaribacter sp.]|uniref:T9SS type A sorting domain-containing protein n=1 Tax=uncultured Polaribacter sp. TaxID=174711 RepID=UPI0026272E98|nr:T9SS type A sorting domain-containing protein [uncultured Polaribacter sp.]